MTFPATPAEAATDTRTYLRRTSSDLGADHPITTKVIDEEGDWSDVTVLWTYESRGLEFGGSHSYSREAYDADDQHIYGGLSRVVDLTSGVRIPVHHFH
tara:strand:+ start:249 stop:545 length:297 start_codon:yes stop_codon:yes gene_type:complete